MPTIGMATLAHPIGVSLPAPVFRAMTQAMWSPGGAVPQIANAWLLP
jgi:hypothetical protein